MELRVDGKAVSVTMRTPGNDFELALGFCLTEGLVDRPDDVAKVAYCAGNGPGTYNVVEVTRRVQTAAAWMPPVRSNSRCSERSRPGSADST